MTQPNSLFDNLPALALSRARRLTSNPAQAEDLAQEALLRVWAQLRSGAEIADPERYLMITLRHLAGRLHRRNAAAGPPMDDPEAALDQLPGTQAPASLHLACAEVLQAMRTLPARESELLKAQIETGAAQTELAARYDLPLGTVASRLARARARLRRDLGLTGTRALEDVLSPVD